MSITDPEVVERIAEQEHLLGVERMDEGVAFDIGSGVIRHARAAGLRIAVDLRTWDRPLYFAATEGATADNMEWIRRKANAVRRWQKPTLRLFLERNRTAVLPPQNAADAADFIAAGGGFPLRVTGAGVIGALTVSGLTGWQDHDIAVLALCLHNGLDHADVALPPDVT